MVAMVDFAIVCDLADFSAFLLALLLSLRLRVAFEIAFDPLAGTVKDIDDVPEQVFKIRLDARVDEAAGHRVEDVGYGAAGEAVVGKRPAIGLVLIGTVTVKLHFLKKISAGADRKSTRLNSSH